MAHPRNLGAAFQATVVYEQALGEEGARSADERIIDLMTDLLHLARSINIKPKDVLRIVQDHYYEEA